MPTYHAHCKGVNFRGPEVRAFVENLDFPAEVTYEREPENQHDENALQLFIDGIMVGYLEADVAAWLSPKIDAGHAYTIEATGLIHSGARALWLALKITEEVIFDGQET